MTSVNGKVQAIAIRVGERYFCGYTKTGMVQTAWSLAGAKLFGGWDRKDIDKTVARIQEKRPKASVSEITVLAAEPVQPVPF